MSVYTCKDCGSTHIIYEVVDFCGDCRSYNLGMKLPDGRFEEETEEFLAEVAAHDKAQAELKQSRLEKELNEEETNKLNKESILKRYEWYYKWFDAMEAQVSAFRNRLCLDKDHKELNEMLRDYWKSGLPEIKGAIKNETPGCFKTYTIDQNITRLERFYQRIENFIRTNYAETGLINKENFENKMIEIKKEK